MQEDNCTCYDNKEGEYNSRRLCMRKIKQENRTNVAIDYIFNQARGWRTLQSYMIIPFCPKYKLTHSEIKNEVVPFLQSQGFDVWLNYIEDFKFDEDHFDNSLYVIWSGWIKHRNLPNPNKSEEFSKDTDYYHYKTRRKKINKYV